MPPVASLSTVFQVFCLGGEIGAHLLFPPELESTVSEHRCDALLRRASSSG
jgi:hypothetical protein